MCGLLRGTRAGSPGSWVRLDHVRGSVEGAIWDGSEPIWSGATSDRAVSDTALNVEAAQTVVFRVSDTVNLLPRDFARRAGSRPALDQTGWCNTEDGREIRLKPRSAALITGQVEISLMADSALPDTIFHGGRRPEDDTYAVAAFNLVEGIFDEQPAFMITASDVSSCRGSPIRSPRPIDRRCSIRCRVFRLANAPVKVAPSRT